MSVVADAVAETGSLVRKVLSQSDQPLTVDQILSRLPAHLRVPAAELESHLATEGFSEYPASRGKRTFLDRTPTELARVLIRNALQRGPQTKSELAGSVAKRKALEAFGRKAVERVLDQMVQERQIYKLTPFVAARTPLFSLERENPRDYVRHAMRKVSEKLGLPLAALMTSVRELSSEFEESGAPPPGDASAQAVGEGAPDVQAEPVRTDDLGERLLQGIVEINPRALYGDLVLIAELRQRFDFQVDKPTFDGELLKLAGRHRVALHGFDRAGSLSDAERDQLVVDAQGRHFNAVSLRNAP
ncbi:MAG: hypothetical protein IT428_00725 [Planctomycetaceae bacterium]|nr:hypothetical protein [Planctomycetaceae bacterium]